MRFKFVDDLSILERLNLILQGLSSYNFRNHVASDIGIDQKYLPSQNFQSQGSLSQIEKWTEENKTMLNVKKSNIMIFNFTLDFQFSTRLYLENNLLDTTNQTKLLGTVITADMKWHQLSLKLTTHARISLQESSVPTFEVVLRRFCLEIISVTFACDEE